VARLRKLVEDSAVDGHWIVSSHYQVDPFASAQACKPQGLFLFGSLPPVQSLEQAAARLLHVPWTRKQYRDISDRLWRMRLDWIVDGKLQESCSPSLRITLHAAYGPRDQPYRIDGGRRGLLSQ
jgi:hypothetical protein